jgi:hypothetical protein
VHHLFAASDLEFENADAEGLLWEINFSMTDSRADRAKKEKASTTQISTYAATGQQIVKYQSLCLSQSSKS